MPRIRRQSVRHVRAGQLPPTELPTNVENYLQSIPLRRIDADQLQPGGIYFSEPPEHVSTPETRSMRAEFWRSVVLPVAIITLAVVCYVAIVAIG